jgi:hypothetical protein
VRNAGRARIATAALACAVPLSAGCARDVPEKGTGGGCLADSIGVLRLVETVPACAADDLACRAKCLAGDAVTCLARAYSLQRDSTTVAEAEDLFRRACLLGAANACTNHAAGIWSKDHTDEQLECAERIFAKGCAAKEHFACGMVGRLMIESSTPPPPPAEARRHLETACRDVGGFACRVLARNLESGTFGERESGPVAGLLARACAGGDPDACGAPATAEETFR